VLDCTELGTAGPPNAGCRLLAGFSILQNEADMKKVAMIGVTPNAIAPMMEAFAGAGNPYALSNHLDTGLMDLVNAEGRITERSLLRLISMLAKAAEDGVDAALLTCTVFSPHLDRVRPIFPFPVISADGAMIERAIKAGGRLSILCTFPATVDSTSALFRMTEERLGLKREMELVLVKEAFDALQRGDRAAHDRLLVEKIRERQQHCDAIVLAQMSMATIAAMVPDCRLPIFTSPRAAVELLGEYLA